MRKPNISGLVKKCKELWNNILEIKDIIEEANSVQNDPESNLDPSPTPYTEEAKEVRVAKENSSEVIEKAAEPVSETDEEFSLDQVKELFELYVGVIIVGFTTYKDDVPDIEQKIQAMLLANVDIQGKDLWLKLSRINGTHGGYIKISPSVGGQFSEKSPKDEPAKATRYRLNFYGEDAIEYIDKNNLGQISYFAGYR